MRGRFQFGKVQRLNRVTGSRSQGAAPTASFTLPGGATYTDGDPIPATDTSTGSPTSWQWQRSPDNSVWTNFTANGTSQNPSLDSTEYGYGGSGGVGFIRLIATNAFGSNTSAATSISLTGA